MLLLHKLKALEKQIVFLRWATGDAFGKIQYVGKDLVEFSVINADHNYDETIYIRPSLILEIIVGGNKIGEIIAEVSHKLDLSDRNN